MKKSVWRVLVRSVLLAAAVGLLVVGGALAGEKVLTIAGFDTDTVDPQMTTAEYFVPLNVFDRLVQVEPGSNPPRLAPMLAESWEISEDGKVFTFHLRKGVKFHNGDEFTAEDVAYTIHRLLNPATKSVQTDIFDSLVGARERLDGKAETVPGIEVLDPMTIRLTLREPYAPFLAALATPGASIFSKKFTEPRSEKFGLAAEDTCGTGPFVLKEYALKDHFTLDANTEYWGGRPKLDKLIARIVPDAETLRMMFLTGEIDVFDCDQGFSQIPFFMQDPQWKDHIQKGPRVGIVYIAMNNQMKPFDNPKVRQAFQMAVDRKKILETVYFGNGTLVNGIIPRGLVGYNPSALPEIEYNPAKAKELLKEAGYPDGCDIVLTQVTGWSNRWVQINELVQQMVKAAGFNATLEAVDSATYYARRKEGKVMAYPQIWSLDSNDPDGTFYAFFFKNYSFARSIAYNNEAAMNKIEELRFMADPAKRLAEYNALEKTIVHDDAAWLPLFSVDHLYVLNPRVKNFVVPWNGWSDMSYHLMDVE